MTTILVILLFGLIVWALVAFGGRLPASARMPLGAAIMLGLTGYLLVGRPGIPGAPQTTPPPEGFGEELTDPRGGMTDRFGPAAQWLAFSDGLIRTHRTEDAAHVLERAIQRYPGNVDLWVAYGNALVAHSGGIMTPAAAMAFDRAAAINPTHPAPPFFAGLALATSGDVEGARAVWQRLLASAPADAPWRADLEARLSQLPPAPSQTPSSPPSTSPPAPPAGEGSAR